MATALVHKEFYGKEADGASCHLICKTVVELVIIVFFWGFPM